MADPRGEPIPNPPDVPLPVPKPQMPFEVGTEEPEKKEKPAQPHGPH
ncbi:MAG: hypothetical protein ACOY94_14065 [Bacillota bacterium]